MAADELQATRAISSPMMIVFESRSSVEKKKNE
jgi:hypothetical protein